MRIAEVSTFSQFSVGKIMRDIKNFIDKNTNDICHIFYSRGSKFDDSSFHYFGNSFKIKVNALIARIFDNDGFCFKSITKNLIRELKKFKPDVVHIHCLHGYYMNVERLFEFFKANPKIHVVWTMHDTWAFTGHCCFFGMVDCQKWKKHCNKCPQKKEYPATFVLDRSNKNYILKNKIFNSLEPNQMELITPSDWLNKLLKESFLKKYNVMTIHNTIDYKIFNKQPSKENVNLPNKKILLGVASVWDKRKGLDTFLELSKVISDDWHIVLIGRIDSKIKFPSNITHIKRTTNQEVLKTYYQKATVLLNPTLDDNFPTVNLEAQACGCKVLCRDIGGAPETQLGNLTLFISDEPNELIKEIQQLGRHDEWDYCNEKHDIDNMAYNYYKLFCLKNNKQCLVDFKTKYKER